MEELVFKIRSRILQGEDDYGIVRNMGVSLFISRTGTP